MSATDPRRAVIDKLSAPAGTETVPNGSAEGWQAISVTSGSLHSARPTTIEFLKEHGGPDQRLFAVSYLDEDRTPHIDIIGTVLSADGTWNITGMAGGSGEDFNTNSLWLNIGAWSGAERQSIGGWLHGSGSKSAATAQLLVDGEVVLEDTVENRVALFSTGAPIDLLAATVRILDGEGQVLAEHSAL